LAEEEWGRLAKEKGSQDPKQSGKIDWTSRCRQFGLAVLNRARPMLTEQQAQRLKVTLSRRP
jgi:hypothetical protein